MRPVCSVSLLHSGSCISPFSLIYTVIADWALKISYLSEHFDFCLDITVTVDWALKTNYLSV